MLQAFLVFQLEGEVCNILQRSLLNGHKDIKSHTEAAIKAIKGAIQTNMICCRLTSPHHGSSDQPCGVFNVRFCVLEGNCSKLEPTDTVFKASTAQSQHTAQHGCPPLSQSPRCPSFHRYTSIRPILAASESRLTHGQTHENPPCLCTLSVCVASCSRLGAVHQALEDSG